MSRVFVLRPVSGASHRGSLRLGRGPRGREGACRGALSDPRQKPPAFPPLRGTELPGGGAVEGEVLSRSGLGSLHVAAKMALRGDRPLAGQLEKRRPQWAPHESAQARSVLPPPPLHVAFPGGGWARAPSLVWRHLPDTWRCPLSCVPSGPGVLAQDPEGEGAVREGGALTPRLTALEAPPGLAGWEARRGLVREAQRCESLPRWGWLPGCGGWPWPSPSSKQVN